MCCDAVSFTVPPRREGRDRRPLRRGKSTIFHLLLRFYDSAGRRDLARRRAGQIGRPA